MVSTRRVSRRFIFIIGRFRTRFFLCLFVYKDILVSLSLSTDGTVVYAASHLSPSVFSGRDASLTLAQCFIPLFFIFLSVFLELLIHLRRLYWYLHLSTDGTVEYVASTFALPNVPGEDASSILAQCFTLMLLTNLLSF